MVINKEVITALRSELSSLLKAMNNPNFKLLDAEVRLLSIKLRDQALNKHLNSVDIVLLEAFGINSKEEYQKEIIDEIFPQPLEFHNGDIEKKFVEKLSLLTRKENELRAIQNKYLTFLTNMKEKVEFVHEYDKNILFNLFLDKRFKSRLKTSKTYIKEHKYELSKVHDELNRISKLTVDMDTVKSDFDSTPQMYYQVLKEKIHFKEEVPNHLIYTKIIEDVNHVTQWRNDFNLEKLDQEILVIIEKLKSIQVPVALKRLSLDHLAKQLNQEIDLSPLSQRYKSISDLTEVYIEDIQRDFDYTLEEGFHIKNAVIELVNQMSESFHPRINIDALDRNQENLVRLVMYRQKLVQFLRMIDVDYNPIIKSLKEDQRLFRKIYLNEYKVTLSNQGIQEQIAALKKSLVGSYMELLPLLNELKKLKKPENFTVEEVRIYFLKDSASFYATLEHVTGVQNTSSSSIPSYIREAIEEQSLESQGLSDELILRPYQEFGTKFALYNQRTLLGDEMGLGKTIQAIAFINHLFNEGFQRAIVLAPLSVLANWRREIKKWSNLDTVLYRGNQRESVFEYWYKKGGVLLTNFEQAKHLLEAGAEEKLDIIIVDEAHFIKNPNAMRTQNTNRLAEVAKYAIFMTGTPLENRISEMRQLVRVLQPELSDNFDDFDEIYDPEEFKEVVSSVYLRRKRDEVLKELPEISYVELWSDFSKEEQDYYDQAVMSGISGLMRMRRAGFYGQSVSNSEKIAQLVEIIEEAKVNGHKVIVFSFFKIVLNMLKELLNNYSFDVISGDVSNQRRQEIIDEFTLSEDKNVLLSQIDAGGVGLNIQAANIVVLCEPQWKPSTENQAIGRVYRMGQTRNVIVYRLLTEESIDETMLELIQYKTDIFNTYAHDSLVADTFDKLQRGEELSENEISQRVYEIEKTRIQNRLKTDVS